MRSRPIIALVGFALVLSGSRGATASPAKRYALIVANQRSLSPGVAPLEYADDDAAKYAEFFGAIASEVEVLAVLDRDAERLHPGVASRAKPPDRPSLLEALRNLFARIERDRAARLDVVFYFVMIGHGELAPSGEGYVSLLDSPFSRADLYREVLAKSPATINHVIIDACDSYFIVNQRGEPGPDVGGPSRGERFAEELSRYPNTGVLLSTSSAKESHEWSAYRAGVFSHELRSAMTGAADVNGDGAIDYSEIHAFVAAANLAVDDPRARVEPFVQPPRVRMSEPLVVLPEGRFSHYLAIPKGRPFRFYVEDDRGVRYADANVTGELDVYLGLLPRDAYWVRTFEGNREKRIELAGSASRRIVVDRDSLGRAEVARRGSSNDSFRAKLFAEPFGRHFHRGFAAAHGYLPPNIVARPFAPGDEATLETSNARPFAYAVLGGGVLFAGGAILAAVLSHSAESDLNDHLDGSGNVVGLSTADAQALQDKSRRWAIARTGLGIGAGAALATGLAVLLWPDGEPPTISANATPTAGGAIVSIGDQF
jgi:hypothetical protein